MVINASFNRGVALKARLIAEKNGKKDTAFIYAHPILKDPYENNDSISVAPIFNDGKITGLSLKDTENSGERDDVDIFKLPIQIGDTAISIGVSSNRVGLSFLDSTGKKYLAMFIGLTVRSI